MLSYQLSVIPRFCKELFKTAKTMVKTNQAIIGEQCTRIDDDVLANSDKDKKIP